jgi:hypothetical protein
MTRRIFHWLAVILTVCPLLLSKPLFGSPPVDKIAEEWNSNQVLEKLASVILPLLAVDESKCYKNDPKGDRLQACMHSIWAPITKKADQIIADKSRTGDIALVQLLDFYTWDFRYSFEEEVVARGPRMLPLIEYLLDHCVCGVESICRKPDERILRYKELEAEILRNANR